MDVDFSRFPYAVILHYTLKTRWGEDGDVYELDSIEWKEEDAAEKASVLNKSIAKYTHEMYGIYRYEVHKLESVTIAE